MTARAAGSAGVVLPSPGHAAPISPQIQGSTGGNEIGSS